MRTRIPSISVQFIVTILLLTVSLTGQNNSNQDLAPFALPDIRPVGKSLSESELKPSSITGGSNITASHTGHDQIFRLRTVSIVTDPDNVVIAVSKGDFPIGQSGTKLFEEINPSETTINSSFTVWQTEYGGYVLSTVNEEDKFYHSFTANNMKRIYPFGDGARISFQGKVVDFFTGYTFEADNETPFSFELSNTTGLTYISGNGRVFKANEIVFQTSAVSSNNTKPDNEQEDLNTGEEALRKNYIAFLEEEGFKPTLLDDGDVRFKKEGSSYYLEPTDDALYFKLVTYFTNDSDDNIKMLKAINLANGTIKAIRIYTTTSMNQIKIEVACYLASEDDYKAIFYRSLDAVDSGIEKLRDKYGDVN